MHASDGSVGYMVHLAVPFWPGMVVKGSSGEEDENAHCSSHCRRHSESLL